MAVVRPCPVHANVCALVREVTRLCSQLGGGTCCVGLVAYQRRHRQPDDDEERA